MPTAGGTWGDESMDRNGLDRIHICDLLVRCIVGINDEERVKRQDVVLNVTLFADLRKPCASDDIADTIDYKKLKLALVEMVENSEYFLIERLADEAARICLGDSRVEAVRVRLDKPGALRFARTVSVEIERTRSDYAV